ncbi:MAG: biopolymer transporter ExbD [Acidobacteriota bacterium]
MELRKKREKKTVINITSLIDVLFLLLIFMMVSSSFIEEPGIKLNLPETKSVPSVKKSEYTLFVKENGNLFLNNKEISLENLENSLKNTVQEMKDESLILKGDKNIPYGKVVKIMDIVKKSGVKKLVISTRQDPAGLSEK